MRDVPDIVIGSGPSGVSVAMARLSKGRPVLMLDAGKTLDAQNQTAKDALAAGTPQSWSDAQLADYKDGQLNAPAEAIRKFGSDFAVEGSDSIFTDSPPWIGLRASRAAGGLSNVWGASILPSAQCDIDDWPISAEDLTEHYQSVAGFMPVSGRRDALETVYPDFPMKGRVPLPFTSQTSELLRRADALDGQLGHVMIGAARNAVSNQCICCGLCLHGCPYGHIWSAAHTLETLKRHRDFSYQDNVEISGFTETNGCVEIFLSDGQTVEGKRLFVGAGVLETARIYLNSLSHLDQLTLLDSQHFFTPLLHQWTLPADPQNLPHHTLAGVFAEFEMNDTKRLVHSQFYTWNEQYQREMTAKYGSKLPFASPLFERLSKRLIVAQTFLHSDFSGKIELHRNKNDGRLIARNLPNPKTDRTVRLARKTLRKDLRRIGLHALGFAGHSGRPGSSFHVGGSLGMNAAPTGAQTDVLGRVSGLTHTHAVDASVMPGIPASTITFTVMANAHRIGIETPS